MQLSCLLLQCSLLGGNVILPLTHLGPACMHACLPLLQGVFAACPTETRVITVIDVDTNWPCGPC